MLSHKLIFQETSYIKIKIKWKLNIVINVYALDCPCKLVLYIKVQYMHVHNCVNTCMDVHMYIYLCKCFVCFNCSHAELFECTSFKDRGKSVYASIFNLYSLYISFPVYDCLLECVTVIVASLVTNQQNVSDSPACGIAMLLNTLF